jgi:hypothetical protein
MRRRVMEGRQVRKEQPGQEERREPQAHRERAHGFADAFSVYLPLCHAATLRESLQ